MLKRLNNLYEKYSIIFKLIVFITPLLFGTWKYVGTYIDLPDRIQKLEDQHRIQHRQDSVRAVFYIHKIDSLLNVCSKHERWISNTYYEQQKIKEKLKLK